MKIALITFVTPASENIRGTSALPYHLMKERSLSPALPNREGDKTADSVSITIYTFNNNGLSDEKIAGVEKALKCTIKKVPLPGWYRWMFKLRLLFLRIFFRYPFLNYITLPERYVEEIKAQQPDLIWVMGEELSRIVKQFPGFRRIQIGPDTESLYYYRMMGRRFVMNNPVEYWKCAMMYRKYARMERDFCTDKNFTYYAVGEEDVRHLQQINPKVKAKFLRHPHYGVHAVMNDNDNVNANIEGTQKTQKAQKNGLTQITQIMNDNDNVNDKKEGTRKSQKAQKNNDNECSVLSVQCSEIKSQTSNLKRFHQPKIKVLIAGQYNYYMKQEADLLVEQICNVNDNANDNSFNNQSWNYSSLQGSTCSEGLKNVNVNVSVPVIREHYVFTFLGKGWERHVEAMREAGYEVEHITFAPDYIEEISKHDIQITPIAIGTGTKGKVLDALANGLLVIGTPYAMENIAVKNGESCVVYQEPQEVINTLLEIIKNDNDNGNEISNREKYERIAAEGQRMVLKYHDRALIAKQLFGQ